MGIHHVAPGPGPNIITVTPESAGWTYLSFDVVSLGAGESFEHTSTANEIAIVPLAGSGTVQAGEQTFSLSRSSVFEQIPEVVYTPPGTPIAIEASGDFQFSIGGAPAEGKYPVRLFTPDDMKQEVRGGGRSHRQVNHVLAPPLPAERLILYEVYVPRGMWSGWPPHCHDGYDGSPYLEEVYYFRFDPPTGFCLHRNWRVDEPFDETFVANDGETVLVTKGYHSTAAAAGSHMFFLNYLAGELIDDQRVTPPCFHQDHTWIEDNWDHNDWNLPVL